MSSALDLAFSSARVPFSTPSISITLLYISRRMLDPVPVDVGFPGAADDVILDAGIIVVLGLTTRAPPPPVAC